MENGYDGTVIVKFVINTDGAVGDIEIEGEVEDPWMPKRSA
ncbi:energy transducer TonB [uncultured Chitinophaga sp.]